MHSSFHDLLNQKHETHRLITRKVPSVPRHKKGCSYLEKNMIKKYRFATWSVLFIYRLISLNATTTFFFCFEIECIFSEAGTLIKRKSGSAMTVRSRYAEIEYLLIFTSDVDVGCGQHSPSTCLYQDRISNGMVEKLAFYLKEFRKSCSEIRSIKYATAVCP